MWFSLLALLLVGAASAVHYNAWGTDNEYHYILESRSLTGLPDVSNQFSGILMRGVLKIQPVNEKMLLAKLSKVELARIHTQLPHGWASEMPENVQEFQPLATSGKPFKIKMQRGIIKELIFDKNVPTWEVNIHKSVLSQLQIDTQGENMILSRNNQPSADGEGGNAMFKTMEDSIGGNCEVLYDINELTRPLADQRLQHLPGKEFKFNDDVFEMMKTKNYEKCQQRVAVNFGIPGNFDFEPGSTKNGEFLSKSSITEVTLTGNLKAFTIHSSVTTEKIILSPNLHDSKSGVVASRVNLALSKVQPILNQWALPSNSESVGNLVYTYEQPFSPKGNDRNPGKPTLDQSFKNQEPKTETSSEEKHKHHSDDSSASSSDELEENVHHHESESEKKYFLQPTPTMNEPPQYPMLPLFIGNKGKALSASNDLDLVTRAKKLASEIGSDVQNPNSIPQEQTLEKFTILIGILRTLSTQQLREVQQDLHQPPKEIDENDERQTAQKNTWMAFRDAVTSAGTGPALVLITELIKERKLNALEVMHVLSILPKAAKEPTPEYINVFFKLATELEARREDNPKMEKTLEVLRDDAISTSAILSFTELLRYAQVSHRTGHNRFSIHAFGSFAPMKKYALFRDYFPYLIEKLEQGIAENSARATVYIRALGNVAHPKVLSVFEPYLEGTKPSTIHQRQMMVIALDKLTGHRPKAVQGLAYRLYLNTGDSFKIRSLAVFLLMKTNPSLAMLQRMAQFTNEDVSKHVNAVVKSLIEAASELKEEESQVLARNARTARTFLTPEIYADEYSAGYGIDGYLEEVNIHYASEISWIGAEDSASPQGIYKAFNTRYGDFRAPKDETGIMVTSVKDFYKILENLFKNFAGDNKDLPMTKKGASKTEKIVNLLDIEGRSKDKFEFFFLSRDKYMSSYFMVGENLLSPIPQEYIRRAAESLKSGKNFGLMYLENFEFTVGFPTATGLPFIFDFQIPRLNKLSGKIQALTYPDLSQGSFGPTQKLDTAVDLRIVISQKVQSRFGFITPFEGEQYVSGVDTNLQVHIPMSAKIQFDAPKNQVRVKMEPINKNEESNLFHYSRVPFTSRQDIKDLKPTSSENRPGKLVMKQGVQDTTNIIGKKTRGWSFKMTESKAEGSLRGLEAITDTDRALEYILFPMVSKKIEFYAIDVHHVPIPSSEQVINLLVGWDTISKNKPTDDQLTPNSHRWASKPKVSEPSNKMAGSPSRRMEMMHEALKDLPIADAVALDIALEIPGQESLSYILTTAVASSKIDGKYKALLYARSEDAGTQSAWLETCATAQVSSPRLPAFDSNKINREELKRNLDIKLSIGKSCANGVESDLLVRQWQSTEFGESLEKHQKMYEAMGIPKTFMDRASVILRNAKDDLDDKWQNHSRNTIRLGGRQNSDWNKFIASDSVLDRETYLTFNGGVEPGTKKALFHLKAPMWGIDVRFKKQLIQPVIQMLSAQSEESYERKDLKEIGKKGSSRWVSSPESVCVLEQNYVNTFDGAEYPLNLTKCWYSAVTSVPEKDLKSSKPGIKSHKLASVLIRKGEYDESKREVLLSLEDDQIDLAKPGSEILVKLNQKPIDLLNGAHFAEDGKEGELQIIKLSDDAVRVESKKFGLKITFDGHRLQIKLADEYRDSVRGLCGNYDSEPSNDLLTPHNRLSSNPDDFTAFYILPVKECEFIAKGLGEKEKSLPADKPRLNNVVSDREAGRTTHPRELGSWGSPRERDTKKHMTIVRTKIIHADEQTCFSLRPLPTCAPGATPRRVKSVLFPVYCLPNGESSNRLSDRILRGANPDFSQKSPSMKMRLDIAEHCSPAA